MKRLDKYNQMYNNMLNSANEIIERNNNNINYNRSINDKAEIIYKWAEKKIKEIDEKLKTEQSQEVIDKLKEDRNKVIDVSLSYLEDLLKEFKPVQEIKSITMWHYRM